MVNTEAWNRVAARRGTTGEVTVPTAVTYGPDLPTDDELRLCGDLHGKRVLDLGCGGGENAVALARRGAHVIALDRSKAQLARARRLAEEAETRVEWHESDVCDLAFLRADSIDLALGVGVVGEVDDVDRLFRQVHRVLRPGAAFVFSVAHPLALTVGREGVTPGALALGALEVQRSYFDTAPVEIAAADDAPDERIKVFPRTIAETFASLHRAGYRVDVVLEPEPRRRTDPGPSLPTVIVWRARKEGV